MTFTFLFQGCKDKYRDFRSSGRVRYRSFSREVSPSRGRYRSRSPQGRGRGGRDRSRSRSRGRGGGRGRSGGRDDVSSFKILSHNLYD